MSAEPSTRPAGRRRSTARSLPRSAKPLRSNKRHARGRLLILVACDDDALREELTRDLVRQPSVRIAGSTTIERAFRAVKRRQPEAIVAYADTEEQCRKLRELAQSCPDVVTVALVSDIRMEPIVSHTEDVNHTAKADMGELPQVVSDAMRSVILTQVKKRTTAREMQQYDAERLSLLTPREREVLVLTAQGLSLKEICHKLKRSHGTVARHRSNIMDKTMLRDRVALTRFAIRTGLIEP